MKSDRENMAKHPAKYSPLEQKVNQLWQVYHTSETEKFWRVYEGFLAQAKSQASSTYQDANQNVPPRPAKPYYSPIQNQQVHQPLTFFQKYRETLQNIVVMFCLLGLFVALVYGMTQNKATPPTTKVKQVEVKKKHDFLYYRANVNFKKDFNPMLADSVVIAYHELQAWTYIIPNATRKVMESKKLMEEKAALLKKTQTKAERKALESAYKNYKNEVMALERQLQEKEMAMEQEKARYNKAIAAYKLAMQKQQNRPVDKIIEAWERQMQLKTPQNLNKTNRAVYELSVPTDKEWFFMKGDLGAELFRVRHFKGKYYKMREAHSLVEIDTATTNVYKASLPLFYRKNLVKYDSKGAYGETGIGKYRFALSDVSYVEKWIHIVNIND